MNLNLPLILAAPTSIRADGVETRQSIDPQIVCESRPHSPFSRQSTQRQEQDAGSSGVKLLYPKNTV